MHHLLFARAVLLKNTSLNEPHFHNVHQCAAKFSFRIELSKNYQSKSLSF